MTLSKTAPFHRFAAVSNNDNVLHCDRTDIYITTQSQTSIFCTPLSSTTPTRLQPVAGSNVGRYISEFQHSLQGIYTRTARILYPVDYVKTYSCSHVGSCPFLYYK